MRTLEKIKAMLYDAEEREIRERSVKLWLKELKKVSYDAEDVLSEYQYEVTRVQVEARKDFEASGSHKRKQTEYIVPIPDGMVDRLNKIKSRFDEIAKDREALELRESDGVRRPNNKILRPLSGHMVDEARIFGRDAEIKRVVNFLLSWTEKSFSVISIVGKGGLGKTTIAQLAYKDERVSQCFDLFGWVCVSEEFDVRRLIKATIESVSSKKNIGVSEMSPLQEELTKTVKGKTILLVLDDMWNENLHLWDSFRDSFKEAKMVKIIVTTRNHKVAEVVKTKTFLRPTYLPQDSSWQLFQHYAFGGTLDMMPTHLVDMGREIMKKCSGLPLAVKSIASLLSYKTNDGCWREILENDLWESDSSKDIFPALQISYAHLPPYLKPCFLFCSMYPKYYILEKMNLIELWISHGYIQSRGNRKITEIGVEYYEELKERSFLDCFSNRSLEYCKLHDIIHDLARLISENEHYSMVCNQSLYINEIKAPQEAYHLYVGGFGRYAVQFHQQNLKGLRTLSMDLAGRSEELEIILTKFESLRVLQLKGYLSEIPYSVFKLKHLAHLRINTFGLKTLPLSIGLLYNLQTLILDSIGLEHLPESIGDLANLQFLNIKSYHLKKLPKSLCSLSNLLRLVLACDHLEEVPLDIRNLHNLRELTIFCQQTLELPKTIGCLMSLEELNLSSHALSFNYLLGCVPHGLVNFPAIKKMQARLIVRNIAWLKDLKALEGKLSIEGLDKMSNLVDAQCANLRNMCKLEALGLCWGHNHHHDPLQVREPCLRLRLKPESCEGGVVGANDVDFPLLEYLQPHPNLKNIRISCYPSATLPPWMTNPFSLKSIQQVVLQKCDKIQSLPFCNLHTLKELYIYACSSIRVLQLEQLSSQLEKLQIFFCDYLELITGLGKLDKLAALKILGCRALKSVRMDELQLVESTEAFDDSSHENPHTGQQSISSLKSLDIQDCKLLCVLPDGMIPFEPCYVRIWRCGLLP